MAEAVRKETVGATDLTKIIHSLVAKADNGIVTIAPGIAKRIVDEINYSRQRPLRPWRVTLNEDRVKDGVWNPRISYIQIALLPDGAMVLVNGQHRLHAFASLGIPVKTRLDLIPVADQDEVSKLYTQLDGPGRTNQELANASGIDEAIQVAPRTAEILVGAVAIIENGMEPDVRTSSNVRMKDFTYRSEKAMEWDTEAKVVQEIIDAAEPGLRLKLRRASTMAVMLYTLRHEPKKAFYFWMTMADNDGLPKRDPRNTLHIDLLTRNLAGGNRRQGVQQSALAWNAWFQGRQLKIIKCITGAEITIAGTPMAKGVTR